MKRVISIIIISFFLITQTGCWNAREINELAFVLSIAIDKCDEGFKITAQIAKPDVYSKTPSGGMSTTQKEKPFWVISSTGKTIFEAVRNMAEVSPRRIFWSHIKVIILGEEMARSNILEIFDFFSRNPELRLRTWIAVTPGEAGKLFEVSPLMEKDPSQNIEKIIEKVSLPGKAHKIMLKDFLEEYLNPYLNPVTSKIVITEIDSRPAIKLEGAAVFNESNMAGWLDETEARGLLWIENKINGSTRVVNCPFDGLPITLEIKTGKTSTRSRIENGLPNFTVKADAKAKIVEKACLTEFRDPQKMKKLEEAAASAIKSDIQAAVTAAKNYKIDFLDFNGELHRKHSSDWHRISDRWPEIFSQSDVDIQVKVSIPEVSLLAKSLTPIEDQGEKTKR